jgi:hypothetical protein
MFEDYQSTQDPRRKASLSSAKYWAAFLATPDDKTLFVGLYASTYTGRGDRDRPWPHDPERVDKANEYDVYNLELQTKLGDLIGKLVIDWGPAMLSWVQYAEKNDKAVLELRPAFREPDFPGCLTLSRYHGAVAQLLLFVA